MTHPLLPDNDGRTALHVAAECGLPPTGLEMLIDETNVNVVDNDGNTALHLAVMNRHHDIVDLLLCHHGLKHETDFIKADINIPDKHGYTCLFKGN